ncbi:hypothetical protein ACB098_12G156700 [Castanea mollissima]
MKLDFFKNTTDCKLLSTFTKHSSVVCNANNRIYKIYVQGAAYACTGNLHSMVHNTSFSQFPKYENRADCFITTTLQVSIPRCRSGIACQFHQYFALNQL